MPACSNPDTAPLRFIRASVRIRICRHVLILTLSLSDTSAQISPDQPRSSQISQDQPRSAQINLDQPRSAQISPDQPRSVRIRIPMGSGRFRVGLGQV